MKFLEALLYSMGLIKYPEINADVIKDIADDFAVRKSILDALGLALHSGPIYRSFVSRDFQRLYLSDGRVLSIGTPDDGRKAFQEILDKTSREVFDGSTTE
jgi:hypothetical protein